MSLSSMWNYSPGGAPDVNNFSGSSAGGQSPMSPSREQNFNPSMNNSRSSYFPSNNGGTAWGEERPYGFTNFLGDMGNSVAGKTGRDMGEYLGNTFNQGTWGQLGEKVGGWGGGIIGDNAGRFIGKSIGIGENPFGNWGKSLGTQWGKSIGNNIGNKFGEGMSYMGNNLYNGYQSGLNAFSSLPSYFWGGSNPNSSSSIPMYAQGGGVNGLHSVAQNLRRMGQGSDKILAHINPEEAMELQQRYGGDINPHTGLPQYGWFSDIAKSVAPILGTVLGSTFGGPLGGILGGALGGVGANSGGNRHDMLRGGIGGGLGGAISGYGPSALSALMGGKVGGGTGGLSSIMGGMGGRSGNTLLPGMGEMIGSPSSGRGGEGFLGNLMGQLTESPIDTLLGLTTIAGMLGRKEELPHVPTLSEEYDEYEKLRNKRGLNRSLKDLDSKPKREYIEEEEETPFGYTRNYFKNNYAEGGDVGYHLDGETDGQEDKIDARLSDGEYVIHAPCVSALGNGNNKAGAQKLDKFMKNVMTHTHKNKYQPKAKAIQSYMR